MDTEGFVLKARVHSARLMDRDGIKTLLATARDGFPRLSHVWLDAAYNAQEKGADWVEKVLGWSAEIVRHPRKLAPKEVMRIWAREWAKEGVMVDWKKLLPHEGPRPFLPKRWIGVWPRCDAECSPERGYYYHPWRHSAGQPIVAGWAYQFVAELNFARESWTAPVDVERVRPQQDVNVLATEQVKVLLGRLGKGGGLPLFVFDAGYDPVKVQQGLEGSPCQILVRLRAGRRFFGDPSLAGPPAKTGRPRRHGPKMKCNDPSTWPEPSAEHVCEDAGHGTVRVRAFSELHPKVQNHQGRGGRGLLPIVVGTLILVEVERLPRGERRREPRVLWLWWHGPEGREPDLSLLWRSYVRRFDLEHTFRFLKQSMGWTTPRVRHPELADRWTWLVVAAFTQLRLARACVADLRLPWERRYEPSRLTPTRVHRTVSALLVHLGTPAKPPKPCGRSPGRPKGRLSGRAECHPALKKSA